MFPCCRKRCNKLSKFSPRTSPSQPCFSKTPKWVITCSTSSSGHLSSILPWKPLTFGTTTFQMRLPSWLRTIWRKIQAYGYQKNIKKFAMTKVFFYPTTKKFTDQKNQRNSFWLKTMVKKRGFLQVSIWKQKNVTEIDDEGISSLLSGLETNTFLTTLNLDLCGFSDSVMNRIIHFLATPRNLAQLSLKCK